MFDVNLKTDDDGRKIWSLTNTGKQAKYMHQYINRFSKQTTTIIIIKIIIIIITFWFNKNSVV